MNKKLGSFSGKWLINSLTKNFGYQKIRQRGSHVRLKKNQDKLTIPLDKELGKGIKNKLLKQVAEHTGLTVDKVIEKLKK